MDYVSARKRRFRCTTCLHAFCENNTVFYKNSVTNKRLVLIDCHICGLHEGTFEISDNLEYLAFLGYIKRPCEGSYESIMNDTNFDRIITYAEDISQIDNSWILKTTSTLHRYRYLISLYRIFKNDRA